jgi:hypothetical protein
MQEKIEFWRRWFKQFQVIETLGGAETKTILDLETFEQENGFLLPGITKAFVQFSAHALFSRIGKYIVQAFCFLSSSCSP